MAKSDLEQVAVSLSRETLQKLYVISQVSRRHVGDLIRDAVEEHIKKLSDSDSFQAGAEQLQRQHSATIDKLLDGRVTIVDSTHNQTPPNNSNVTPFPRRSPAPQE